MKNILEVFKKKLINIAKLKKLLKFNYKLLE